MGLTTSLSNALTGMDVTQRGLTVLSRNVANAGTPGYHKQSLTITDGVGASSTYARTAGVQRAFSEALQRAYNQETSAAGYADVRSSLYSLVEAAFGKPGDANSLDTLYGTFQNALKAVATSPDDYATRSQLVASAQSLAQGLNGLTDTVQQARQETENQISGNVTDLNHMLSSLQEINNKLSDQTVDEASRASMLDERDRLVAGVSELVDTQVVYRDDDTVALYTSTGLGLLDKSATQFEFKAAGNLNATSRFDINGDKNGVGTLLAHTPSGLTIDVVQQGILKSGRIAGLIDMRDKTLVQVQSQLDAIASGLAQSLSTVETDGTAVSTGSGDGFDIDIADLQPGNSLDLSVTQGGSDKTIRVIRVDDPSKLPMDQTGPNGERVIGISFAGGAAGAAANLQAALGPGFSVSNPGGDTLRILDDGTTGTTDVNSLSSQTTSTGTQGDGLALSLFTDGSGTPFTNSLDGVPQARGFAGRIAVNQSIVADNTQLVQYAAGGTLGDSSRPDFLVDKLNSDTLSPDRLLDPGLGDYRLNGNVGGLVSQVMNFQGGQISAANDTLQARETSLNAVQQRIDSDYGVNVDEEMARLMELQNGYAASARVISVVQDLINTLMNI